MARTFRRHRTVQPIAELNVTNLIDLGFTLLIIFMITTSFSSQEQTIPVNLPVEGRAPQAKPDPDTRFESITVKADGSYLLGNAALSLAQLGDALARFEADEKPPVFRLRFDAKSTAQQYLSVMAELQKRHLSQISFDMKVVN